MLAAVILSVVESLFINFADTDGDAELSVANGATKIHYNKEERG